MRKCFLDFFILEGAIPLICEKLEVIESTRDQVSLIKCHKHFGNPIAKGKTHAEQSKDSSTGMLMPKLIFLRIALYCILCSVVWINQQ